MIDHQSELLRAMRVPPEEIDANRIDRLGPVQARRLARSGYLNLLAAFVLAGALLAIMMLVAERPLKPVQIVLALVLVAALLITGSVYLIRSLQAADHGVVERHSGPVRVVRRGRAGFYLHLGDHSWRCPVRPWHLQNGAPYHVYVAPKARRIVAMEPAWT